MRRVVLDSNAIDPIIDWPGALDAVRQAVADGRLHMYVTHVQHTEIGNISNPQRRARMQEVLDLTDQQPAGVFVFDAGRFGDRFGPDDGSYERITRNNPIKNAHDAMIALTASVDGCALVTADRKLRITAAAEGIEVLKPAELLLELGYTSPATGP